MVYEESPMPEMEAVSIFDLYPDPYATSVDDMRNIFRRHIISRQEFVDLKDYPGFNRQLIDYCVEEYPDGNHYEEQHEKDRREIANINDYETKTQKFEVTEFWGSVNGHELVEVGVEFDDNEDLSQEFQCNIWFTEDKIIKAQLNPFRRNHSLLHFSLRKEPSCILGNRCS